MQLIKNGPEIPEHLLQAHEDGKVVFFCGSGISCPAGLPNFAGLVEQIYSECKTTQTPPEKFSYDHKMYDKVLDLLEQRFPGQRAAVRKTVAKILQPNLSNKATSTHKALLKLSQSRNNNKINTRLITTNFDRIFENVIASEKNLKIKSYIAPLLPVPKNSCWNGIVYLHGLLPTEDNHESEGELNQLVLTSGDFGLAYLKEQWAARFISELFCNYIVCFVGYSIDDPILRYMMDALAADRMLGKTTPQAYAFGPYSPEKNESHTKIEWEAKGVIPILYNDKEGHKLLHSTLNEWAEVYCNGVLGKEAIIARDAMHPPMASTQEDNYVGRILWAISDKTGLPARRFANLEPTPSIDWLLDVFIDNRFTNTDLQCFDVTPEANMNEQLKFSFVFRPASYVHAPKMSLVNSGVIESEWDDRMREFAPWLTHHLNEPKLILWLSKNGGQLHPRLIFLIQQSIEKLHQHNINNNQQELDRIRQNSPQAIPSPQMLVLWRLLLSGRIKSPRINGELHSWVNQFKQTGLTPALRFELRNLLRPCIILEKSFYFKTEEGSENNAEDLKNKLRWEITLFASHPYSDLKSLVNQGAWDEALPELLQDFILLLRDTLDLMRELGDATDRDDISYRDQPSISEHPQNKNLDTWTDLIRFVRDAWIATKKTHLLSARLVAEGWWHIPYPIFKRLALFAACEGVISAETALEWLLSEDAWWLWPNVAKREVLQLLITLAPKLSTNPSALSQLEQAILRGPPREMFKENVEPALLLYVQNKFICLRLSKIQNAGMKLSQESQKKLKEFIEQNPSDSQIATDEHYEFSGWSESSTDHFQPDDWQKRCHTDFEGAANDLVESANRTEWLEAKWNGALQVWSTQDELHVWSWERIAPTIFKAPDELIQNCIYNISWWLQEISKTIEIDNELFFKLIKRILDVTIEEDDSLTKDPVGRAINHPIGHVTEALLQWWGRQSLHDNQNLPSNISDLFADLCNTQIKKFRHGRVLLAHHAVLLFRVDRVWATKHILTLFNWEQSKIEARLSWHGFLWASRTYLPLLEVIKQSLLDTVTHYAELDEFAEQYVDFFTFSALEYPDFFKNKELTDFTSSLLLEGLGYLSQSLRRKLEGVGEEDKRSQYWNDRIKPFFREAWPKQSNLKSSDISENFAFICIAAGFNFPDAIETLKDFIVAIEHPNYFISELIRSDLPKQFPADTLTLIDKLILAPSWLPTEEFGSCLESIKNSQESLVQDLRYKRLEEHFRRISGA